MNTPHYKIAVAPMMDCTDRHCRYLLRLLSKKVWLYTEMIPCQALLRDPKRMLSYSPEEHPVALQLGGSSPPDLAACVKIAHEFQYDEVNLNVGCPSPRVKAGRFGACLLLTPALVVDCYLAMAAASPLPITIKTRIGVDDHDSYELLCDFIQQLMQAGCREFIIHARKAWLEGLNPKQNRSIPPLRYDVVARLVADFPTAAFSVNGGIRTLTQLTLLLQTFKSAMIGRAIYENPYFLAAIAQFLWQEPIVERRLLLERYADYMDEQLARGVALYPLLKPLHGIFHGLPEAKQLRKKLVDKQQGVRNGHMLRSLMS